MLSANVVIVLFCSIFDALASDLNLGWFNSNVSAPMQISLKMTDHEEKHTEYDLDIKLAEAAFGTALRLCR